MPIDHVIYVTTDLDRGAAELAERVGAPAAGGGRHVGMGTHNRLIPLGSDYIEVLAIADPDEAAAHPFGRAVQARLDTIGEGLFGWVVRFPDVAPIAARHDLDVTRIERDGLSTSLAGMGRALADPGLPAFIERDEPGGEAGITWLEVSGGWDPEYAGEDLPVRAVDGPPGVVAMGIGDHELR